MQKSRGNRTGRNFSVRISEAQMEQLEQAGHGITGPAALGPWLLWAAIGRAMPGPGPGNAQAATAMPELAGKCPDWQCRIKRALPDADHP